MKGRWGECGAEEDRNDARHLIKQCQSRPSMKNDKYKLAFVSEEVWGGGG
jgi:hypothetical protein